MISTEHTAESSPGNDQEKLEEAVEAIFTLFVIPLAMLARLKEYRTFQDRIPYERDTQRLLRS